jgi:hypothetical protein
MHHLRNHLHLLCTEEAHSRFWSESFGLAASSFNVIFTMDYLKAHGMAALYDKIRSQVIDANVDVLLIDASAPVYDVHMLAHLKQAHGLMIVLLMLDDEFKFDWMSSSYATVADLVLTTDYVSATRYRQAGINAYFFMLPIYVPSNTPVPWDVDLSEAVTFVGRVDPAKPTRRELIDFLQNNGVHVTCFASVGPDDPSYLHRDEMYSVFHDSAINLSFAGITTYFATYDDVLSERIRGNKARPLEIAAAEGFCLSEFSISISKMLDDKVEIVFFKSRTDLLEKIRYYVAHQEEARRIAANAAQKIRKCFSAEAVANRFKELVEHSVGYIGVDLYAEPQRVRVSRSLAGSFAVLTFSNAVGLLGRGNFDAFFRDCGVLVRFMRHLAAEVGFRRTLQTCIAVIYDLIKQVVSKAKSTILRGA